MVLVWQAQLALSRNLYGGKEKPWSHPSPLELFWG